MSVRYFLPLRGKGYKNKTPHIANRQKATMKGRVNS